MTNRARGEGEEGSWGRLKIEMRDGERQNGGVLYNPPPPAENGTVHRRNP